MGDRPRAAPMKKTKRMTGAAAFDAYYGGLFGSRWAALRAALLEETRPVPFSVCTGKPYYLDRASIYAAEALPPAGCGRCLDMCAAPGGKTLVLASRMGPEVHLQANELSRVRRARLIAVLTEHLPEETVSRIEVTGYNAAALPRYRQGCYDRILLDAPCSSERHVITDTKYLERWTPARIKMLAQRQWALLSAAFLLLKPGGFLVYATCALADAENDGVVQKLLKKYGKEAAVRNAAITGTAAVRSDAAVCSRTEPIKPAQPAVLKSGVSGCNREPPVYYEQTLFGCRFLPDISGGIGPMYFSLIEKNAGAPKTGT